MQVGRAGRDGSEARCHLFLDDADFRRLRSLSHSDAVSADSVHGFLEAAFGSDGLGPCAERCQGDGRAAHYAVLGVDELSRSLDMKPEVMETLLTYLEVSHLIRTNYSSDHHIYTGFCQLAYA